MSREEQRMNKHTQKIDQQAHMDELERERPDPRAVDRFRRPPYKAARMIRDQGRQLEHKSVAQYIADKFGIDGEDDNRGQENT